MKIIFLVLILLTSLTAFSDENPLASYYEELKNRYEISELDEEQRLFFEYSLRMMRVLNLNDFVIDKDTYSEDPFVKVHLLNSAGVACEAMSSFGSHNIQCYRGDTNSVELVLDLTMAGLGRDVMGDRSKDQSYMKVKKNILSDALLPEIDGSFCTFSTLKMNIESCGQDQSQKGSKHLGQRLLNSIF